MIHQGQIIPDRGDLKAAPLQSEVDDTVPSVLESKRTTHVSH